MCSFSANFAFNAFSSSADTIVEGQPNHYQNQKVASPSSKGKAKTHHSQELPLCTRGDESHRVRACCLSDYSVVTKYLHCGRKESPQPQDRPLTKRNSNQHQRYPKIEEKIRQERNSIPSQQDGNHYGNDEAQPKDHRVHLCQPPP